MFRLIPNKRLIISLATEKLSTLNVMFHWSPSLTISMVGLVFASTFLYFQFLWKFSLIFCQTWASRELPWLWGTRPIPHSSRAQKSQRPCPSLPNALWGGLAWDHIEHYKLDRIFIMLTSIWGISAKTFKFNSIVALTRYTKTGISISCGLSINHNKENHPTITHSQEIQIETSPPRKTCGLGLPPGIEGMPGWLSFVTRDPWVQVAQSTRYRWPWAAAGKLDPKNPNKLDLNKNI